MSTQETKPPPQPSEGENGEVSLSGTRLPNIFAHVQFTQRSATVRVATHTQASVRMRASWLARMSPREWHPLHWPAQPTSAARPSLPPGANSNNAPRKYSTAMASARMARASPTCSGSSAACQSAWRSAARTAWAAAGSEASRRGARKLTRSPMPYARFRTKRK